MNKKTNVTQLPAEYEPKRTPRELAIHYLTLASKTGVRGNLKSAIDNALSIAEAPKGMDLTDPQYDAIGPGGRLLDPSRPGFLARRNRTGVRFVYRFDHPESHKQCEIQIGYKGKDKGQITLEDARKVWLSLRAQRMEGKVPQLAEQESTLPTMKALCRRFLAEYSERVKKSWAEDQRLLERHVIPAYGHLRADEFTTEVARGLFKSLDDRPRERDKTRAVLSTLFNVAVGRTRRITIAEPWLDDSFPNPIVNAATADHRSNVTVPPVDIARDFYRALLDHATRPERGLAGLGADYSHALLLQLLMSCRISEVTGLRWSEVDLAAARVDIPADRMKSKRPHTVFLSDAALEILRLRREWAAPADAFVFPAASNPRRPMRPDLPAAAMSRRKAQLGLPENYTSHMCRHMFSTWAAEHGATVDVVNRCTAHVISHGINAIYNQAKLDGPARDLWQAWSDWLAS